MAKFKAGDKVVIIEGDSKLIGLTGIIDANSPALSRYSSNIYFIDNNKHRTNFEARSLELYTTTTLTFPKFNVGDKVRICKSSNYYTSSSSNPKDVDGVVIKNSKEGDHPYCVKWDNGQENSYREVDLELSIRVSFKYNIGDVVDFVTGVGKISYDATLGSSITNNDKHLSTIIRDRKFNDGVNWYLTEGYDNWLTEGSIKLTEATKEEITLLEPKIDFFTEAKKRYPVGTTYKCAYNKALYTIVEGDRYEDTSSGPIVYPKSGLSGKYLYLYHTKIWAEIVPKTVEKPLKKDHSHLIRKKFRITREPTSEEWGKMGRIPQEKMGRNNYIITNVKEWYEDGIYYIKNSNWWWPLSCIEVLSDYIPYIGENIITGWRYDGNTYIADTKQYPITSKTCIASENEYIQSPLSIKRPRKAKLIVV